jgi:hypothetical protein
MAPEQNLSELFAACQSRSSNCNKTSGTKAAEVQSAGFSPALLVGFRPDLQPVGLAALRVNTQQQLINRPELRTFQGRALVEWRVVTQAA